MSLRTPNGVGGPILFLVTFLVASAAWAQTRKIGSPHCEDIDPRSLLTAIDRELGDLRSRPGSEPFGRTQLDHATYVQKLLLPVRTAVEKGSLCRFLNKNLVLRPVSRKKTRVTAYYHPVLRGSKTKTAPFVFPLYRRPKEDELAAKTTREILDGGLGEKGLEIVYLDSLLSTLHVHIEGSATIALADGTKINLTTDGHNGHPYQNPLRLLVSEKRIPEDFRSPPGQSRTHAFVQSRPEILREYWSKNPHFVFFKETPLQGTGKFGELCAGRSIAIDPRQFPMGALLFLRSQLAQPPGGPKDKKNIFRFVLAQDTGAAIVGDSRVDLFLGSGDQARFAATHTSSLGQLFWVTLRKQKTRRPTPTRLVQAHID